MSKKFYIILVVLIVVLVVVGVWVGMMLTGKGSGAKASAYSSVELSNGAVYFGKLSWWPSPHMNGALILQRYTDEKNQPQVTVVPVDRAFWKPVTDVYFNEKDVVTWSYLQDGSELVKALDNPALLNQQQQAPAGQTGQPQAPAAAPAPETKK